jgi:Ca-activated chloride channel family protein
VTEHLVDVEITDQIALTTLNQTFRNDTSRRLEATYVFPLPENAELTNFQMSFNGKLVEGKVLPAQEARQIYESIVRQSKDPGLIEFIGRRLLQMRVFPIEPNSDTKIQVKYQQVCKPISGMNGYHYPLRTAKAVGNASQVTGGQAYGTLRFAVNLHASAPLKTIWSPTHSVEIVRDGEHGAKIAFEANRGSLEDDFVLLYATDSSDLGLSAIAYKPMEKQPGHFVLTLTPKQLWPEQEYQPQDVVFVIDTSGSMAGEQIEQAKTALKFCIDKLEERDRFGIVRFSTGFDVLFEQPARATKEKRAEAQNWVGKFSAAGGTNINDALKQALDMRPGDDAHEEDRPFVIVFITDGQGNQTAEETLKEVKKHKNSEGARIFTFGVGHEVNTILIDQLATNHSGKPTYVQPGENLELVLGDFFSVISQPVLTNVKLSLPDVGVTEKFPAMLGDVYHGQQLIIAGKFDHAQTGQVTLSATRNGQNVEFSWPDVSLTHTAEAKYVPAIWAGRKIAYLIDQIRAHGESEEMVAEVVALGQEYGIQTPYTSWLVNPERINEVTLLRRSARPGPPMSPPAGIERQREMLREGSSARASGRGGGGGAARDGGIHVIGGDLEQAVGDIDGDVDGLQAPLDDQLAYDDKAVGQTAGKAASLMAQRNAAMREARSKDAGGVANQSNQLVRKLGDRWYNRIGRFWIDENVNEGTKLTVVRFGSSAYFDIASRLPELRTALAASQTVVVMVNEGHAVLISDRAGIEEFSDEQWEQTGLPKRSSS